MLQLHYVSQEVLKNINQCGRDVIQTDKAAGCKTRASVALLPFYPRWSEPAAAGTTPCTAVVTVPGEARKKWCSSALLFILNSLVILCLPPHPCNAALA